MKNNTLTISLRVDNGRIVAALEDQTATGGTPIEALRELTGKLERLSPTKQKEVFQALHSEQTGAAGR